jgi:TPP-dependent 2-oxoacid decarboxylase
MALRAPSAAMDPRERAVIHYVRNEAELRWELQGAADSTRLHLIEVILPRLDAPEPLARFARKAAEFDFPQLLEEEIDQVS